MAANPDDAQAVTEELRSRGRTRVCIQGRSMYPTLRHGDQVAIEPVAYDEVAVGDMVVFCDGRGIVCHRLLRKASRQVYLKGDTNLWMDPPVGWPQVLGRVTHVVEAQGGMRAVDRDAQRRQAAHRARFSHAYALYYNLLHLLGQCRWWARSRASSGEE